MSLSVLLFLLIHNSHSIIFKQDFLFSEMEISPKEIIQKKNFSSLQNPCCLIPTPECFSSQVTFSEVSKCGIHLTWLLHLCPVSLSGDTFGGGFFCPSDTWPTSLPQHAFCLTSQRMRDLGPLKYYTPSFVCGSVSFYYIKSLISDL